MTTVEGVTAWRLIITGGGQWIRSGMDSTIVGLDLTASLSRPSARDCDQDALEHLLMIAEAAVVSTLIEEKKNAE